MGRWGAESIRPLDSKSYWQVGESVRRGLIEERGWEEDSSCGSVERCNGGFLGRGTKMLFLSHLITECLNMAAERRNAQRKGTKELQVGSSGSWLCTRDAVLREQERERPHRSQLCAVRSARSKWGALRWIEDTVGGQEEHGSSTPKKECQSVWHVPEAKKRGWI